MKKITFGNVSEILLLDPCHEEMSSFCMDMEWADLCPLHKYSLLVQLLFPAAGHEMASAGLCSETFTPLSSEGFEFL